MRMLRRGTLIIQIVAVAPLLLLLGAGISDYGCYYSTQQRVAQASQEALQAGKDAAVGEDPAAMAEASALRALEEAGTRCLEAEVEAELLGTAPDQVLSIRIRADYHRPVGLVPTPDSVSDHQLIPLSRDQGPTARAPQSMGEQET